VSAPLRLKAVNAAIYQQRGQVEYLLIIMVPLIMAVVIFWV